MDWPYSEAGEPVLITQFGRVKAKSRNLRGILDYARRSPVDVWNMTRTHDGGARVTLYFHDGACARFCFADWTVAQGFIRARRVWELRASHTESRREIWFPKEDRFHPSSVRAR